MKPYKSDKCLKKVLRTLDETARRLVNARGYTNEVQNVKLLEELLKEQLINENSRTTTR